MTLSKQELFAIRTSIEDLRRDGQPQTIGATLRNQIRNLLADRDELAAENAALRPDAKLGAAVRKLATAPWHEEGAGGPLCFWWSSVGAEKDECCVHYQRDALWGALKAANEVGE